MRWGSYHRIHRCAAYPDDAGDIRKGCYMMEHIRSWILSIAMAALAGGLVWLLAPKGNVQKAVRTLVAVFLLSAFIMPLFTNSGVNLDWVFPDDAQTPTNAALDDTVSQQLKTAVEAEMKRQIEAVLGAHGIAGQISLDTSILPDGSIEIVTAEVAIPGGTSMQGLAEAIKAATGLDVQITQGR